MAKKKKSPPNTAFSFYMWIGLALVVGVLIGNYHPVMQSQKNTRYKENKAVVKQMDRSIRKIAKDDDFFQTNIFIPREFRRMEDYMNKMREDMNKQLSEIENKFSLLRANDQGNKLSITLKGDGRGDFDADLYIKDKGFSYEQHFYESPEEKADRNLEINIGDRDDVEEVGVTWGNGKKDVIKNPSYRKKITFTENK